MTKEMGNKRGAASMRRGDGACCVHLALVATALFGCGDSAGPSASASSSARPPAPSAATSSATPAKPTGLLEPSGVEGAPAPGELGRLPRGASTYASIRLEMLDVMAPLVPQAAAVVAALAPTAKGKKLSAAFTEMGVDPSKPILSVTLTRGLDTLKARAAEARREKTTPLVGLDGVGAFIRHELPLVAGADPKKLLPVLAAVAGPRKKVVECPAGQGCADVGGEGLIAIAVDEFGGASLRVVDGWARFDDVSPFGEGAGVAARALKAFGAEPLGGPAPGRCARFDLAAQTSVCVDAQRTADGAAAMRLAISIGAVASVNSVPSDTAHRTELVDLGDKNATYFTALGSPTRLILDDGTLLLSGKATQPHMVMSWSIGTAARASIEAALPAPLCSQGAGILDTGLDKLIAAFGEGGAGLPDLAAETKEYERVPANELLVLWGRTWPNFAAPMKDKLKKSLRPLFGPGKACVKVENGRLELDADVRP